MDNLPQGADPSGRNNEKYPGIGQMDDKPVMANQHHDVEPDCDLYFPEKIKAHI